MVYSSAYGHESTAVRVCMMDSDLFPLWRGPTEEDRELPGINIDLINSIARATSLDLVWIRAPFQRCLVLLQQGEADILNAASYRQSREVFGRYPKSNGLLDVSKRLKYDTYNLFVYENSNITWDGKSFNNLGLQPVAIEIGASIESTLHDLGVVTRPVAGAQSAFMMLQRKRVAAVATNINNGLKFASDEVKSLTPALVEKPYFLVISHHFYRQNPELSERIWEQSAEVQLAEYDFILSQYAGLLDWPSN